MLIPEILPGELARGYLGRLRTINGFPNPKETVRVLRHYLGERSSGRQSSPVAILLAKALQMPTEAFCRQHTMLPYMRAVTSHLPDMKHGVAGSENVVWLGGMSTPQPGACFCRSCVTEDMDFWGYAYFRRSHQLPGVPYCEKHREPLLRVADEGALYSSPCELLERSDLEEASFSASILDNPTIDRYAAIAGHWLHSDKPIPTHLILRLLQMRAELFGLRRGVRGRRSLLSDQAMAVFPSDWLASIFPSLPNKRPFEFYSRIDAVLRNARIGSRSESYALALAMLFDTVEDALNEIDRSMSSPHPHIKCITRQSPMPEFWFSEEFFKLYIESRGSPRYVAEKVGLANTYVTTMMKAVGFPGLGCFGDACLHACFDLEAGMSLQEACAKWGANPRVVEKLIPVLSDRFVSAIKAILSKQNGFVVAARRVEAEPVT